MEWVWGQDVFSVHVHVHTLRVGGDKTAADLHAITSHCAVSDTRNFAVYEHFRLNHGCA